MKINLFDIRFWHFDYALPWMFLFGIVLLAILVLYVWKNRKKSSALSFKSGAKYANKNAYNNLAWLKHSLFSLKLIALALIICALAKPFSRVDHKNHIKKNYEGIDIVLAMDISGSMLAMDFRPNRLESAKNVATDFINGRLNDRVGLVVYEGESFTKCPLTTDYDMLKRTIPSLYPGTMKQGTAIGTGLATAVNRLRDSKAKSKVIILLSDGANNSGEIAPINGADIAKEFGIKVYTIGIGKLGLVPFPNGLGGIGQMQSDLDEATLKKVAEITGGQYFHAENSTALKEIYNEIDQLEKTQIKSTQFLTDPPAQHYGFVFVAVLLIAIAFGVEWIFLKQITH